MTSLSLLAGRTVRVLGEDDAAKNTKDITTQSFMCKIAEETNKSEAEFS